MLGSICKIKNAVRVIEGDNIENVVWSKRNIKQFNAFESNSVRRPHGHPLPKVPVIDVGHTLEVKVLDSLLLLNVKRSH